MKNQGYILSLLLMLVVLSCQTSRQEDQALPIDELRSEFENPSNAYRAKPFWAWNGELEEDELIRQIHLMKQMGFGGFFMHSRTGLKTEYLGEKWFELTKACADEAQKLGLEAWLYDEDRWPSGLAGGIVTQDPAYQMQYVSLYTPQPDEFSWTDSTMAVFTAKLDSLSVTTIKPVQKGDTPVVQDIETLLVFVNERMAPWSFYNNYTYLNTMKRAATDKFIEVTHERYKELLGDELGNIIEGIFTDEPHNGSVFGGFGMQNANALRMTPWTDDFATTFKERFGYNLIDSLPALFYLKNGETFSQVKWHYMEHCQQLYLNNFAKPVLEWCKNNNLILTGHALHENTLTTQSIMQGSLMRNYEYFDYPGIDYLGESTKPFWIAKQLASVGRQLDKPFMLTETYGVTGWQTSFESYKAIGDWQALYGINLRCPHLSWYTMEGEAKRDYPASIFYQSAWWKEYKYIEDYYARLGLMVSQGRAKCDLLVINPIESLWGQVHTGWAKVLNPTSDKVKQLEDTYQSTFTWLQQSKIDFDYADEEMLSRYVKVTSENGKPLLQVGSARYSTVLVSGLITMRLSTLKALQKFSDAGGVVVFTGTPPGYIDALPSNDAVTLAKESVQVPFKYDELIPVLTKYVAPLANVVNEQGEPIDDIYVQARQDGDRTVFVLMNTNRNTTFKNVQVELPVSGVISEWNCETGQVNSLDVIAKDGKLHVNLDFYPITEYVLMVTPHVINGVQPKTKLDGAETAAINGPFDYSLSEPNLCVLDMALYTIEGKQSGPLTEILKVDQVVRDYYALPNRQGKMVQPWFRDKYGPEYFKGGSLQLTFPFYVDELPADTVFLALETPEFFQLSVNGKPLEKIPLGWHIDRSIQKFMVPVALLKRGLNNVELSSTFTEDMGLEAVYLGGDFGVTLNGTQKTLTQLPAKLAVGNIVPQGLPFYSGTITYKVPLASDFIKGAHKLRVETGSFEGVLVKVGANTSGKSEIIAWAPYQTEIDHVADTVEIELILSRRNTFGPLHLLPNRPQPIGPQHFITKGKLWSDNYQLFPAGLMHPPVFTQLINRN